MWLNAVLENRIQKQLENNHSNYAINMQHINYATNWNFVNYSKSENLKCK